MGDVTNRHYWRYNRVPDTVISTAELCRRTGMSYRRVWVMHLQDGFPDAAYFHKAEGSGDRMLWNDTIVQPLRAWYVLNRQLGLGIRRYNSLPFELFHNLYANWTGYPHVMKLGPVIIVIRKHDMEELVPLRNGSTVDADSEEESDD